ncbi:MAG: cytochrome P450 [Ktedonobacteraceae bacterium]|nr:cytochrome P450 [Ktedonobacteraceae bacterium]
MTHEQETIKAEEQQELLAFPFPYADHSMECPAEYGRLRQECPVAKVHMPYGGDAFLLTRYTDVVKAYTDPQYDLIQLSDGDVPRLEAGRVTGVTEEGESLFSVSNARHNKIRRLVTQAFTVQSANTLRPRVVDVTHELIDAMERKGPPADLFEDYAIQTPMAVICDLLGVPQKDEKLFRRWGKSIISTTATNQERAEQWGQMMQYLGGVIEREKKQLGTNVISTLIKAREQGGDEVITQPELYSFAVGLIAAGFETVSTTFTNSAFLLLQRPELVEQLKSNIDDPGYIASAIEEILRITPIGAGRPRITRSEVELGGVTIPNGEVVLLSSTSANYDASIFQHADEIDFERQTNPMIAFGRGIHACLGQQIARMELQVLWSTLLKRLPAVHLAVSPSEVPWRPDETLTFGPAALPVAW